MKKFLLITVSALLASGVGFAQSALNPAAVRAADGENPTGAKYARNTSWLFFGLDNQNQMSESPVAVGPVFAPITFSNATKTLNSTFSWTYEDTEGSDNTSSDRNLVVTYGLRPQEKGNPYYNNWYQFPILSASSPTTTADSFTMPGFFQAGGSGEYDATNYGLCVLNPQEEGQQFFTDQGLPIFGYGPGVDDYWKQYTFGKDTPEYKDPNNSNQLVEYGNFFYPNSSKPIVIKGVRTIASGRVSREATFTANIYYIGTNFVALEEPDFVATCTGDDITILPGVGEDGYDLLVLNFEFDEPVVITKTDFPYYFVSIGGFNDPENVEYFNPEMSSVSSPTELGLGWVRKHVVYEASHNDGYSWGPVADYTPDEALLAFYIMLDASYPWLLCDNPVAAIEPYGKTTVTLNSSFPGEDLTFKGLPEWLSAKASGRFENTQVTFTAAYHETNEDVTVIVEAPTVSTEIQLSLDTSGVRDVEAAEGSESMSVFSLDGRRVSPDNLQPGFYIVNGKKKLISY